MEGRRQHSGVYTPPVAALGLFYALTFGFSGLLAAPVLASWWGLLPLPAAYLFFSNYGPALAAITTAGATGGKTGITDLLAGLFRWRVGIQWYAFALLAPPAVWIAALGLHALMGGGVAELSGPGPWALLLPALALGVVHEIGEELGWRGYALPLLLARHRPLPASLILAALWAGWHLPAFWVSGGLAGGFPLTWWTLALVAYAILFTWVYTHSNGSVLLAALFHAAINIVPGVVPAPEPGPDDWRPYALNAVLMAMVALIVALTGLSRTRARSSHLLPTP